MELTPDWKDLLGGERWYLPRRGDHALCAVSGGVDSMCLLALLAQWCREHDAHLTAAHFNHRLRPTAGRDEAFVRDWCREQGIDFVSGSADVAALAEKEGWTIEETARNARYAFLHATAERLSDNTHIFTAHHADDNAETVLLNLLRGTGLAGLGGIRAYRGDIYRPLLDVRRETLADFAERNQIPHVEDETNADPDVAARNYLRLEIMPRLTHLNSRAVEHICDAARRVQIADDGLEEEARRRTAHVEVQNGRVTLAWPALWDAPDAVRPRMLLRLFDKLGVGRKDITAAHLRAIEKLPALERSVESRIDLPHGVAARYARGWLVLETRPQPLTEHRLLENCPVTWGDYRLTLLDHREGEGLALRPRRPDESWTVTVGPAQPGDRLVLPETNGGGRSVKRLCLDRRIGLAERDRLPALYCGKRLAAVWRLGVDMDFAPAGDGPCRFIRIENFDDREESRHEK